MHLFRHDLAVASLGSGSRGNCTYIGNDRQGVLIDCGLSTRQISARMDALGLGGAPIDAVLITHDHSDHVGAAAVLDRKLAKDHDRHLPFYLTPGTRRSLPPKLMPQHTRDVTPGQSFWIGTLRVDPIEVPHDTREPVAYALDFGGLTVSVITDLGHPTARVGRILAESDIALVEFNHDLEMLRDGTYPWELKRRIASDRGHLSNAQAADLIRDHATSRLTTLFLGHLSEQNNNPELAWLAADRSLRSAGIHAEILVAQQDSPTEARRSLERPAANGTSYFGAGVGED